MNERTRRAVSWEPLLDAALRGLGVLSEGEFVQVNHAPAREYGHDSEGELVGRSWRELYGDTEQDHIEETVLPSVATNGSWRGQVTALQEDRTIIEQELSVRRMDDHHLAWAVSGTESKAHGAAATADTASWEKLGGMSRSRSGSDGTMNIADRLEWERELERYKTIVETIDDGVYVLNDDLTFAFVNAPFCNIVGRPRERLLGMSIMDLFSSADTVSFGEKMRERVADRDTSTGTVEGTVVRPDGETVHMEVRYRLRPDSEDGFAGSVGAIRDITKRKEREERVQRRRNKLEAVGRITELLHEVIRELLGVRTREHIERVVCERLAESEFYRFVWIGERAAEGDRVVPRIAAGEGDGYLDVLDVSVADEPAGCGPAGRALRTGTVQVSHDIRSDPSFERWQEAALNRGFRSAAAVPLVYEDTAYGVLAIYAARPDGFSEREQAGLAVLGETIGFALRALNDRRLLFADTVVELEFRSTDAGLALATVSESLNCRLELDGHLATGDGDWVAYLSVEGTPVTTARRELESEAVVERIRAVREDDESGLLEVVLGPDAFLGTVSELGARVVRASAEDGAVRVGLETPASADTRDLVGQLESVYPETELLTRSEYDRSVGELNLPEGPMDALTDCQRKALKTAYQAGYFAWPRESIGDEIAETLDVTPPTFHAHLRKAEERLLSEILD